MVCAFCGSKTSVYNSRGHRDGLKVWRRRRCISCHESFTTYESLDLSYLIVAKRSGESESYSKAKLYSSIYRAHLDPIESELLTDTIERKIIGLKQPLLSAADLAQLVTQTLRAFSKASHARYSSFL